MAKRPIFICRLGKPYFEEKDIEFEFHNGFSFQQKQKSIESLHSAIVNNDSCSNVLEVSSSSAVDLGKALSAFNLTFQNIDGRIFTVESAFQSSKVFENGGPYIDLLTKPSIIAKKDERIRESGRIVGFRFLGEDISSEPKTLFYDWIYINALNQHTELHENLLNYNTFTDIEFNPKRSLNCQARSVAIFVSLKKLELLEKTLKDIETFKKTLYTDDFIGDIGIQSTMFDL